MNDDLRARYYATVVHPFLIIFIPFWFFLTIVIAMVNPVITGAGVDVFPPLFPLLMLLVALSEVVTGNLLYKQRIGGILPRLREFIFIVIFGLFFILLFHGDVFRGDFKIGRVKIWLPMLVLAVEWFCCYYLHQKLRERELFLNFFVGKEEREVRKTYDAFMHEGGESHQAMRRVKRFIIVLTVMGFVVLNIMTWGFKLNFRGMNFFIILVFFVGNLLIISFLNTWGETQFIMMNGMIVSRRQKRFRGGLIVLLVAVMLVVAIPLTGPRPLLPESYITSALQWLQSIGQGKKIQKQAPPPNVTPTKPNYQGNPNLGQALAKMNSGPSIVAEILRTIGYVLLALLIAGVVFFLLRPLFRRGHGIKGVGEGLRKSLGQIGLLFKRLSSAYRDFLEQLQNRRKLRVWDKIKSRGVSRAREALRGGSGRGATSRRERRINNRMLRAFFRFTRWGEKRGVPFQTTMGPWEYAAKLESAVPDLSPVCVEIAGMFEEALYSNHSIEEAFRSAFDDKVKQILRTK